MPYINDTRYLSLPQQVKANKDNIVELVTEDENLQDQIDIIETDIIVLEDVNVDQQEQIDSINDTLAAGGILVSRRVETSAILSGSGATQKINFDVTTKESEDLLVIAFDANNDHILKLDTSYDVSAGFSAVNTLNQVKTVTLQLITIDQVTLTETVIDSRIVSIPANATAPINPNYIYTKVAGSNDILLVVRETSDVGVNIDAGAQLSVTSKTATSGTGIATKTKNIGPTDKAAEGVTGLETTLEEILTNRNGLIQKSGTNTNVNYQDDGNVRIQLQNNLVKFFRELDASGYKLTNLADPTLAQDAVTKTYVDTVIDDSGATVIIKYQGSNRIEISAATFNTLNKKISNVIDPTADQDAATKIYVDNQVEDQSVTDGTNVTKNAGKLRAGYDIGVITMDIEITATRNANDVLQSISSTYAPIVNTIIIGYVGTTPYTLEIQTNGNIVAKETIPVSLSLKYSVSYTI